jgi:uncharacterized HAD superfamily protein
VPSLCVDIDNVLGKTDEVIRQIIRDETSGRVDLKYADVVEFEYYRCTDRNGSSITKTDWKRIHDLFSNSKYLMAVQPLDSVQRCLEVLSETFKLHFATSRLPKAWRTTIEWLEKHHFPPHDLHFLRHGEKHLVLRGFYAAVEDNYEQARLFAQAGIPCYVIEHPWNKGRPQFEDVYPVRGWPKLTEILLATAPTRAQQS